VLRPGGTALVMVYHRNSLNYRLNVMLLRRVLAGALLLPHGTDLVAKLTGESRDLVGAHRDLLRRFGLRYLTDRELFLSKNTDGPANPLSKVYSRGDALELFRRFQDVQLRTRFLNLRIYPGGERLARTRLARRLERRYGWFLYIEATKAVLGAYGADSLSARTIAARIGSERPSRESCSAAGFFSSAIEPPGSRRSRNRPCRINSASTAASAPENTV
jgi:hypothetical protein